MPRIHSRGLPALASTGALAAAAVLFAAPVAAQSYLMPSAPERGVGIEVSHPDFKEFDVTAPTSVWFVSGQLPLTSRVRAIVDVPFAYAELKGAEGLGSSTVLGNPFIGAQFAATPSLSVDFGMRAPLTTADDESFADVIGFLSDIQRAEAFMEDVVPVIGGVSYQWEAAPGLVVRGRGGVTSLFYTGDDDEEETETFVDYGAFGTYTHGIARFGAGVSGRWHASEDEGGFSERSIHQLGLTADAKVARVRPGISLRVPLDQDYRDVLGWAVGLYLQVPLP
jgi:hypothetical protein